MFTLMPARQNFEVSVKTTPCVKTRNLMRNRTLSLSTVRTRQNFDAGVKISLCENPLSKTSHCENELGIPLTFRSVTVSLRRLRRCCGELHTAQPLTICMALGHFLPESALFVPCVSHPLQL